MARPSDTFRAARRNGWKRALRAGASWPHWWRRPFAWASGTNSLIHPSLSVNVTLSEAPANARTR